MRLKYLLEGILEIDPTQDRDIHGLSQDTRRLKRGDLFVAYPGHCTDGRKYIIQAIEKGATAVLMTQDEYSLHNDKNLYPIPVLSIKNLSARLGDIAAKFYHYPSQDMTLIGITGTNGKTTCSHFLASCLGKINQTCGVIGTISNGYYDNLSYHTLHHNHAHLTTPPALTLHYLLSVFKQKGIQTVIVEVSSHALDQYRINGLRLHIAALTNISHDHLDYHATIEHYAQTKRRLFEMPGLKYAVFNIDDPYGKSWYSLFVKKMSVYCYTLNILTKISQLSNVSTAQLLSNPTTRIHAKLKTPFGEGILKNSALVGRFALSNLLLVITILGILKIPFQDTLHLLANLKPVKGRMEKLGGKHDKPLVIIDYAHTPDALQTVLQTLKLTTGFLWCIFGCGGNRDRQKRPLMGKIAEQYADRVILTQDNPRYEDSQRIIKDILSGFKHPEKSMIELNRKKAISFAIKHAKPQDIILIAGKGHENYQIIEDKELPFDDYDVAQMALDSTSNRHQTVHIK